MIDSMIRPDCFPDFNHAFYKWHDFNQENNQVVNMSERGLV